MDGNRTEIYYVEDDEQIANTVRAYFIQKKWSIKLFKTIEEAKKALIAHIPSIVLVDWNMPDGEGDELCLWIRSMWKDLPIIFLTVRNDKQDVIMGFQNGADDYVVKPFELDILYSRISALLKRTGNVAGQYLTCDYIVVDQSRMMVLLKEEEISMSQAEYQLLLLLLLNKGKTVTRERLLLQIWDNNGNYVNDNTLTVTMKRLREKLNQPSCVKTIRSFGYRMEDTLPPSH